MVSAALKKARERSAAIKGGFGSSERAVTAHKASTAKKTTTTQGPVQPSQPTTTQPTEKKQGFVSKALDVISAPLSQPKTTFTKGIGAGAAAVKESRERISGAATTGEAAREALKVVGTTVASTAVAAGAVLSVAALASSASGLLSTGASTSRIAAEAARIGVSKSVLSKAVTSAATRQAAANLAKIAAKKTFLGITKRQLTVVAGTLIGGSTLTQWLAADNAAGAASFQSTKIQSRFDNNELTREEALDQIDGQIAIIEGADKFTKINTILNPALLPFRKLYVSTVENNLVTANEAKRLIENSQETTASKFDRLREESDQRDADFAERQDARDRAFAEGKEQASGEGDEEFRERTLLFEAIRKRNAGTELTVDELALLIKFGLDTKIVKASNDEFGRSALNFGLF